MRLNKIQEKHNHDPVFFFFLQTAYRYLCIAYNAFAFNSMKIHLFSSPSVHKKTETSIKDDVPTDLSRPEFPPPEINGSFVADGPKNATSDPIKQRVEV